LGGKGGKKREPRQANEGTLSKKGGKARKPKGREPRGGGKSKKDVPNSPNKTSRVQAEYAGCDQGVEKKKRMVE